MTHDTTALQGLSELVVGIATPIILSIVSTSVRLVRFGWHGVRHLFASLLTSAFVGVVVYWGLDYACFPPTVDASIVSISAYMSGSLLDTLVFRVRKTIKVGSLPTPQGRDGGA